MRAASTLWCLTGLVITWLAVVASGFEGASSHRGTTTSPAGVSMACDAPITYRVGSIDPEFELSEAELRAILDDAKAVWNAAFDRSLFTYAPDGDIAIHLRYDDRQVASKAQRQARATLDEVLTQHEELTRLHDEQLRAYKQQLTDYRDASERLHARRDSLRAMMEAWKEAEASTRSEWQHAINEEQRDIERLKQQILQKWDSLEARREQVNTLVDKINRTANEASALIDDYNERFGRQEAFNKAKYVQSGDRREIVVYQLNDMGDLTRVLAHEFGHALSIEHVDDPSAIMYYRVTNDNRDQLTLVDADREALREVCGP